MAARIADAGFETRVWNRTRSVSSSHAARYQTRAAEIEEAVRADVVFSCLPTTKEVIEVLALVSKELLPESVWVDCTSGDPRDVPKIVSQLAPRQVGYLDAPVSGMTRGAETGELTVMVGGSRSMFERVEPLLRTFASHVFLVGGNGSGYLTKSLNNLLFAVNFWASAEVLACLSEYGVQPTLALQVLNTSSGSSNVTRRFISSQILASEPTPAFRLVQLVKDLDVAAGTLAGHLIPSSLLHVIHDLYNDLLERVGDEADAASTFAAIQRGMR